VSPQSSVVLEVFGEGKTDLGKASAGPEPPSRGVVPILVHTLCGRPHEMRVVRKPYQFLVGKGLWQKVRFAKRQARYNASAGAVFVMDSEGGPKESAAKRTQLEHGRDHELPDFPMAVGVAHLCIEAWLLADAKAIQKAFALPQVPQVPPEPEKCPAPCHDKGSNPKAVLARAAGLQRPLSADNKDGIARAMNDMDLVCERCPEGFAPFADEVRTRIRPLF